MCGRLEEFLSSRLDQVGQGFRGPSCRVDESDPPALFNRVLGDHPGTRPVHPVSGF